MWVDLAPFFGNAVDGGRHSLWMLQARLPNHPHMCNVALSPSARQRVSWSHSPSTGRTGSKGGIRVFNMCIGSSLWGGELKKYRERKIWSCFLLCSPVVDDLEEILHFCTNKLESVWGIPCTTQALSRCTTFRKASARMKVPQASLIPQLGLVLTLVIQLATHVLKSPTSSTHGRQQRSPGTGERILVYLLSF